MSLLLKEHDAQRADWLWQTDAARRLSQVSNVFSHKCWVFRLRKISKGESALEVFAGADWEEGTV